MDIHKFSDHIHARILVVDDHPATASTLARAITLLGRGIEALVANSGEQALKLIESKPVDILVTDMMMPGMDGIELINILQSKAELTPGYLIMMTAYDSSELRVSAQQSRVNDLLLKPVRPERICQLIASVIEKLYQKALPKLPDAA